MPFYEFRSYVGTSGIIRESDQNPTTLIPITDSYPLGRMSRSKFVESFNLAQNGSSVDDPIEVLGPNNGYGTMLVCQNICCGLFSGYFRALHASQNAREIELQSFFGNGVVFSIL